MQLQVHTSLSPTTVVVTLRAGGMSGAGCSSAKITIGVDSNLGTFVAGVVMAVISVAGVHLSPPSLAAAPHQPRLSLPRPPLVSLI